MFDDIILFFKEHMNGLLYLMFFFVVILTVFSNMNASTAPGALFIDTYGKNFLYSLSLISILVFIFSLLGYNFTLLSSSSSLSSSYSFFSENSLIILNVVILFIVLITLFSMLGVDFKNEKKKTIKRVVELEAFTCDRTNPIRNEQQCANLSETICRSTECCGWLNGEKCVSSDGTGKNMNYLSDTAGKSTEINKWCTIHGCMPEKAKISRIAAEPLKILTGGLQYITSLMKKK